MSQVIAGIYEIQNKIGAGGGGIVYLGRHLRLKKPVVLKADKRTLGTETEILRREVDMLKGLSHTYIPQVYDFVQENGVVYTVMDFIEGESLDKLLARKQIPEQKQVIKWACQLLEALSYLHSRPPYGILHGDIKPANIMLRPNGDVCLIDFNIALALGEDGAVKVGFSRGYASPEHYGTSFDSDSAETLVLSESGKHGGMLDARSDIYSLGATLYHLLSGIRPAQNALEVKPLEADVCSPAVAAIVQKAMNPEPDMRYQSADEMLTAFLQLYRQDIRVIRHKRQIALSSAVLILLFLLGGTCSFIGLKQLEQIQKALTLSEYSANALAEGDVSKATELALQAVSIGEGSLKAPVTAQAQKALTDALGVYDLSDGFKDFDLLELPSAPFGIAVSPDGSYFAVVYAYEAAVFHMEDLKKAAVLPIEKSALSDVCFVDETHILYAGEQGVTAYDLSTQEIMWIGDAATYLSVSADHSVVAAVNRDEDHVAIYRIADGTKVMERSFEGRHMTVAANDIFADPNDDVFALNEDGSKLAVSFHTGGLTIFDLENQENDIVVYEESDSRHFAGGFCGKYFAFSAEERGQSLFEVIDTQEAAAVGEYVSKNAILVQADERGIYVADGSLLIRLDALTLEESELAYAGSASITGFSVGKDYVLIATDDNCFSFYDRGANQAAVEECKDICDFVSMTEEYAILGNRNEPSLRIMRLEDHRESQIITYDARYIHDEARISRDGKTVMLFSYHNFCIYDMDGNILAQVELPNAENIYDQQFVRSEEGSWLEVVWYDGTRCCYSAADGSLLLKEMGEAPSKDLYEEFYINKYRIASSLHSALEVYDLKSGRIVTTLEEDSYLTYVTQVGEYIITEYINTSGERYGILLDEDFQKLAYFPGLCDVSEDKLVFDDKAGNLRQCRLYSINELMALGKAYIANH